MKNKIPVEILHYTETTSYKRARRKALVESLFWTLIIVLIMVTTFYAGRVYEQNKSIRETPKTMVKGISNVFSR